MVMAGLRPVTCSRTHGDLTIANDRDSGLLFARRSDAERFLMAYQRFGPPLPRGAELRVARVEDVA